jgi:hypothetical protein
MTDNRLTNSEVFCRNLKFGISNRIDQFSEYLRITYLDEKLLSTEEWIKIYISWTKSNQELQKYLQEIL